MIFYEVENHNLEVETCFKVIKITSKSKNLQNFILYKVHTGMSSGRKIKKTK